MIFFQNLNSTNSSLVASSVAFWTTINDLLEPQQIEIISKILATFGSLDDVDVKVPFNWKILNVHLTMHAPG
jgi:hypothetical protein